MQLRVSLKHDELLCRKKKHKFYVTFICSLFMQTIFFDDVMQTILGKARFRCVNTQNVTDQGTQKNVTCKLDSCTLSYIFLFVHMYV